MTPQPSPPRLRDRVAAAGAFAVTRAREIAARFADLIVAAFAVAAGLAWKDGVFWLFSTGPLDWMRLGPPSLAVVITLAGAALAAVRAYLPLTPRAREDNKAA